MASLYLILVLVSALDPGFSYVLDDEPKTLKLPTEYHFMGDETNILAGVIKPFEIWYNGNKSRVDYYGGTVKHYYVGETEYLYGKQFTIYPKTDEQVTNEYVCTEEDLDGEAINFLPTVDGFTYEGQVTYNDKVVDVWKYLDADIEKKTEKTLYVIPHKDGFDVPVFRESKSSNLWLGTLSGHEVWRYYDYSTPQLQQLDYSLEQACNGSAVTLLDASDETPVQLVSPEIDEAFSSYVDRHNKKYRNNEQENRKEIFKENWRRVMEHNKKNLSYKMTVNKFSDWTDDELASLRATRPSTQHIGSVPFPHTDEEVDKLVEELPKYYDMRIEGFITSVKNQASCGSCWAFSSTAAVEGALARSNGGRNLDLSEQSMVDCAWGFQNTGCAGGTVEGAYKYILRHGLPTQMEYGLYLDEVGKCKLDNMTEFYNIKGFAAVPRLSVNAMKVALYKYGPVTVAINANNAVMKYNNGIFFDPTCNNEPANHGVTVVGYGQREGVDYWIVKNSWGEDWGQDGYILFSATDNNCHLLEDAYYPVV
ncbi:pro-cathepsin H [Bicyclus anynana]|uniref:Pro-cathepsin H n=1 Tax=Bicyclus anynana TaxID=110368 RepID=A0A6J1NJV8_BICAN|nr:pro-cathepsin H [Bicyclus anynana]